MDSSEVDLPAEHAAVLVDPTAYADGRIYETYAWLRANNPIGRARPKGFDPFWVITRHQDVRDVSLDNHRFPYGDRNSMLLDKASDDLFRAMSGGKPNLARSLVSIDPPEHMKYRLLTQAWFAPKHLKTLDERIGEIADRAVARMTAKTEGDFVADVALYYPLEVVMSVLGVPEEDLPFMLRLTQEAFAPLDPDSRTEGVDAADPAAMARSLQAVSAQIGAYFQKINDDRLSHPRNDIATVIAHARIDGEPLPPGDMIGYYGIIATAGHDTTSSSSAAIMYALATQPETLRRVKADPALIPRLVEEGIRWATPVKTFMRSPVEATDHGGRRFEAGDWLMLCYASANRDESVIRGGEKFDIDRPKFDHLAFGYGPHVCLGQHLARRELIMLFERLLPKVRSIELTGSAEMSQSFFVNGLKHLPIRYTLEAPARAPCR